MKTRLLYFLLIFVLLSCSKNDDSDEPITIPADQKFVDRIDSINEDGEVVQAINFEYNPNKQLSKLDFSPLFTITYTYENNRLTALDFLAAEGLIPFGFEYDNTGKVSTILKDGVPLNVLFDNATNTYEIELETEESVTISFNENEDVTEIQFLNEQNNPESTATAIYSDNQYFGTLTNTLNVQMATLMILSANDEYDNFGPFLLAFLSKKPITTLALTGAGVMNIINTYDAQNFLETFMFQGVGSTGNTAKVVYQQIE